MALPASLTKKLEAFLATPSKSTGGWAPVGSTDMKDLADILRQVIATKYEEDPDGDLPVEFELVDRTRYERSNFMPIPYAEREEGADLNQVRNIIQRAECNVAIATSQLKHALVRLDYAVFEPMNKGLPMRTKDGYYERLTPFHVRQGLPDAAVAHLVAHVKTHPIAMETLNDYDARQAWEREATQSMTQAIKSPVTVGAFISGRGKEDAKLKFSLTFEGLKPGRDGAQRMVVDPSTVKAEPAAGDDAAVATPAARMRPS